MAFATKVGNKSKMISLFSDLNDAKKFNGFVMGFFDDNSKARPNAANRDNSESIESRRVESISGHIITLFRCLNSLCLTDTN